MSFFSSPEPEDPMGTLEERESYIGEIISYLSISTIGELVWMQRYLERNIRTHTETQDINTNIFEQKKQEIDNLLSQNQSMISQIADIRNEKKAVEKHIEELEKNISNLTTENEVILHERDVLADELQRVANLYKEMTGRQANDEEIKEVLNIYITLMEEVFAGKSHFKVLSIIHGEKETWTSAELVKSTGITELNLRTVLGDLVRANMIVYDEENATIKLLKRIASLD